MLFCGLTVLISCSSSSDDPTSDPLVDIVLSNVTSELVSFTFTSDTGNNSSRLQYEIRFTNPNDVAVTGFYRITTDTDGLVATRLSSDGSPCYQIAANSSCVFSLDEEASHNLGMINSIQFVSAEYSIEE